MSSSEHDPDAVHLLSATLFADQDTSSASAARPVTNIGSIDLHVGKRVRMTREFRGITLSNLARALGIARHTLNLCERGFMRFKSRDLVKTSDLLRVNPTFFFDGLKSLPRVQANERSPFKPATSFANNNADDANKSPIHLRLISNSDAPRR